MKEKELRKLATCGVCGEGIGKSGVPLFWTIKIERHGLDMGALQRQQGLAMAMGGNALVASVMGPDEDMTKPMMKPVEIAVCESCSLVNVLVAELAERHSVDDEDDEEE